MRLKTRASALVGGLMVGALAVSSAFAAYEETTVKDAGILRGVVRFNGTPPKLEPVAVNKNRDVCGEQKASEALVLGPDRGVKGSVVLIEGVTKGKKGSGDVVIDNNKCLFVAHVTATGPGDRVRVKNSDAILHNTHGKLHAAGAAGKQHVFNLALPTKDQMVDITKRLGKPGVVRLLCDAHPHMSAWMIVHDSPYFAVTDERGAFRIEGVPPGTYKVTMWHEGYHPKGADKDGRPVYGDPHTVTREVTVAPNGAATLDFELK